YKVFPQPLDRLAIATSIAIANELPRRCAEHASSAASHDEPRTRPFPVRKVWAEIFMEAMTCRKAEICGKTTNLPTLTSTNPFSVGALLAHIVRLYLH